MEAPTLAESALSANILLALRGFRAVSAAMKALASYSNELIR
jgi:hypothetical protein